MTIITSIFIPDTEENYYTSPRSEKQFEGFYLTADNLSHGCGGAAITITQENIYDPHNAIDSDSCIFGFTCSKEKLKEIITALTLVYEKTDTGD